MSCAWVLSSLGHDVARRTMTRADMARVASPVPRCTSAANEGANLSMASLETVIEIFFYQYLFVLI